MKENEKINGYALTRQWFDFALENPDKISGNHCALWFWIVELCNRSGWKGKFSLSTDYAMQAIGIRNRRTYYKTFNDLIKWGFVNMITKSKNQHTANIIALSSACVKNAQANKVATVKNAQADKVACVKNTPAEPRQMHKQTSETSTNCGDTEALKLYKLYKHKNKTFFSEKTDFLFKRFLEERKIISETRIESLVTLLKTLSDGNDDYTQLIINKAIAGGYESFVALNVKEKEQFETDSYTPGNYSIKINKTPSLDDFIQFFEENEQPRDLAERVYYDFEYNKHWVDKNGNSFAETWQEVVKTNIFKKNGKRS